MKNETDVIAEGGKYKHLRSGDIYTLVGIGYSGWPHPNGEVKLTRDSDGLETIQPPEKIEKFWEKQV